MFTCGLMDLSCDMTELFLSTKKSLPRTIESIHLWPDRSILCFPSTVHVEFELLHYAKQFLTGHGHGVITAAIVNKIPVSLF